MAAQPTAMAESDPVTGPAAPGAVEPAPPHTHDLRDIKRRSVRGGLVTMGSQLLGVLIQLVSTTVLARLLSPKDYGIVAMVTAVNALAGLFRDLGLSSAAIQKTELKPELETNLFWINVGMGTALTVLVAVCSPAIAAFYRTPEVLSVTLVLSTSFVIGSFGTQHNARLTREMRFERRAIATVAGALVTLLVSLVLALKQASYWALVWGNLAGTVCSSALLYALSPFRPGLPTAISADLRELLRFGYHVTAFDFVNYLHRNLDNVLIGRYWGVGPLGLYTRAYTLLMLPIQQVRGPINSVAFPALSRLAQQPQKFREYYLQTTLLLAVTTMPLAAFLFVAAKPLVIILLGKQWIGVAPIFSYLALAAFVQPVLGFTGSLLLSLGRAKRQLHCGMFNAGVLMVGFLVGLPWGPAGVALSYSIGNWLVAPVWLRLALHDSPVSVRDWLASCTWPAVASATSALLAYLAPLLLEGDAAWQELAVSSAVFGTALLVWAYLTPPGRRVRNLLMSIAAQLGRRGKPAPL